MGQALYRKYRSKSLDELVGQDHITTTLKKALKTDKISHAYLLSGPRGVGKTSVARILAHAINKLPYDNDSVHIDIIEIDAASNRGIEEIRDLREKAQITPTSAKYKVYIIDEVHMLTTPAFNALLKILEEPPAHIVFILATTEAHKLPATIISRCMRFTFKPVKKSMVVNHLRAIANNEQVDITDEALELLAEHGEGSFRDSISLLDQLTGSGQKLDADNVRLLLGIPPANAVTELVDRLLGNSPQAVLASLAALKDSGFEAPHIASRVGTILRDRLVNGQIASETRLVSRCLRQLIGVPSAPDPEAWLGIVLLNLNLENKQTQSVSTATDPPKTPASVAKTVQSASKPKPATAQVDQKKADISSAGQAITDIWPHILETVKQRHNTLYGVLRMARAERRGNDIVLNFAFAFHQKKINEERNRQLISEIIAGLTGETLSVVCVIKKVDVPLPAENAIKTDSNHTSTPLDAISRVFGGAELLE